MYSTQWGWRPQVMLFSYSGVRVGRAAHGWGRSRGNASPSPGFGYHVVVTGSWLTSVRGGGELVEEGRCISPG
jgi:hypothetical protein